MMQMPLSVSGAAEVLPLLPGGSLLEVGQLDASGPCLLKARLLTHAVGQCCASQQDISPLPPL